MYTSYATFTQVVRMECQGGGRISTGGEHKLYVWSAKEGATFGDETIHGLFRYAGMFGHPYNKQSSPSHLFYRHRCYKCILDSLQRLLAARQAPSQSTGLPTRPGPPPVPDPNALTQHDAEQFVSWRLLCIAWDKRHFGLITLCPNSNTSVHHNLMAFSVVRRL